MNLKIGDLVESNNNRIWRVLGIIKFEKSYRCGKYYGKYTYKLQELDPYKMEINVTNIELTKFNYKKVPELKRMILSNET